MTYDFITIGGSTRDISIFTDQGVLIDNAKDILRQELLGFEYGAKVRVDKFHHSFGGGGSNTAVNLANFGFKVACFSALANDENGKAAFLNLKERGVETKYINRFKEGDTGTSFVLISKGERVIFTQRGVNDKLEIESKHLKALKQSKAIYISSLSGKWKQVLNDVFKIAKDNNIKVFWNPSEAQYEVGLKKLAKYLKHTYLFVVNKDEAIELALLSGEKNLSPKFLNDEHNLLKILYKFCPSMVMVTSGPKGAYVYDGKKFYFQAALKEKKRVDMTGVGDAFNSTFAAGLSIYEGSIKKALHLAAKNTASKIAHFGAQNGLLKWKK